MSNEELIKQYETFISILKMNKDLMIILNYVNKLKLQNYYIAGGFVFQTIWNYYDKKELNFGIKDIDIIYYDNSDLSIEKDLEYYTLISEYLKQNNLNYQVDVSNEARMHLWKMEHQEGTNVEQYKSSEDAMSKWIATVHTVGVTIENDKIKVYASYGLNDIFTRTIRPIRHVGNSKILYNKKVESWKRRFNNLNIIEW